MFVHNDECFECLCATKFDGRVRHHSKHDLDTIRGAPGRRTLNLDKTLVHASHLLSTGGVLLSALACITALGLRGTKMVDFDRCPACSSAAPDVEAAPEREGEGGQALCHASNSISAVGIVPAEGL